MKIGILEDNPVIFEYMKTAFEMKGHQVDVYTQGATLLDALFTASGAFRLRLRGGPTATPPSGRAATNLAELSGFFACAPPPRPITIRV